MKNGKLVATRRGFIAGTIATGLALSSLLQLRRAGAQEGPRIVTVQVSRVPTDPADPAWDAASPTHVPLYPQQMVVPRLTEAGTKAIDVRALYDAERIAILLEWLDAHRDADLGTVLQYRDAMAVQFPADPSQPTPSFMMGQKGNGVSIYHWKSDWQFGPLLDVDEAYPNMVGDWYPFAGVEAGQIPEASDYLTKGRREYLTAAAAGNALADPQRQGSIGPVQKMRAEGFGTIEPDAIQDARGKGSWQDGVWRVFISIPRKQPRFQFKDGMTVPMGFAVWDGSRNERNGQKAFSFWSPMDIGPAGSGAFLPLAGGIGGAILAVVATLMALRLWRARRAGRG